MINDSLIKLIENYLEENFAERKPRLKHIINVKKVAISLAKIYKVDLASVIVASLLHDATKYYTTEENIKIIKAKFPDLNLEPYPLGCLHAISAEILAREKFAISDSDILNSIRFHCSGRKNMSKLEKIIFVSDFIEESRDFVTDDLRSLAKKNLDQAVYKIMIQTKAYLDNHGENISPFTIQAIEYYKTIFGGF